MNSEKRILRLPNGIHLATVSMPHMASVSTGLWAGVGSRHENEDENGVAHFVEHLLFKGTPSRFAEDISREIESLGASVDAFTVEDHTCFHTKGPAENFAPILDVLADIFRYPVFDPQEIEFERKVIREEISMVRDQPSQYLEDLISESAWGENHPLGRSITGSEESLDSLNRASIYEFFQRGYCGENTVISVAGAIDHDEVAERVFGHFESLEPGEIASCEKAPRIRKGHRFEESAESEQAQIALAFRSAHQHDPARYGQKLMNIILGENMSSRLFQMIREQKGLCYEIQSDIVSFSDAGLVQVYTALHPENLREALDLLTDVVEDLRLNGVTQKELDAARSYLVGQSRTSLENTASQMMWAGESLLAYGRVVEPEEIYSRVAGVTVDEVNEAAREVLQPSGLSTAIIGSYQANSVLVDWASDLAR